MEKNELYQLYEKLYFHELETRDKITGRLQVPLAIFISIISLAGYMLKNVDVFTDRFDPIFDHEHIITR